MGIETFAAIRARLADRLIPAAYREMMTAYRNETEHVPPADRTRWRRAAARIWLWCVMKEMLATPGVSALAVVCGAIAAGLDLQLSSRVPYVVALFLFAGALTSIRPRRWRRWPLLLASVLPAAVLLTDESGAYAYDHLDAVYGMVPAFVGAALVRFVIGPREAPTT